MCRRALTAVLIGAADVLTAAGLVALIAYPPMAPQTGQRADQSGDAVTITLKRN